MGCSQSTVPDQGQIQGRINLLTKNGDRRPVDFAVVTSSEDETDSLNTGSTRRSGESLNLQKQHIVWKFDPEAAVQEEWHKRGSLKDETLSFVHSLKAELLRDEENSTQPRSCARPEFQAAVDAFAPGTRVEYYSKTNAQWMQGSIEGAAVLDAISNLPCSQVVLGTGDQKVVRPTVSLELLRLPFLISEPVSLYREETGQWVAAEVICKQQYSAEKLGYKVKIVDKDYVMVGMMVVAAAENLRPRYPSGLKLEVYIPSKGWVPASVLSQASKGSIAESFADQWVSVEVQPEGATASLQVPSYRLRFSRRPVFLGRKGGA